MRTSFQYARAESPEHAVALAAEAGSDGHFLAGGTDLYLDWKNGRRLGTCIDINHLSELAGVEDSGDALHVGALTSLRSLEHLPADDDVRRSLAELARVMCTPQTRTLGTVGGNLANSSAAADLPPLLAVLDAVVHTRGPQGERQLAPEAVAAGPRRSALGEAELLTQIVIPVGEHSGAAVQRATRTALDIALVIAAASVRVGADGRISRARICLGSVGPVPLRVEAAEELLVGLDPWEVTDELLRQCGSLAAAACRPVDDVRTTAAYRRHSVGVLTARALRRSLSHVMEGMAS
jgi:aerobic carbon-monoxide dehydrogenase medium subunit